MAYVSGRDYVSCGFMTGDSSCNGQKICCKPKDDDDSVPDNNCASDPQNICVVASGTRSTCCVTIEDPETGISYQYCFWLTGTTQCRGTRHCCKRDLNDDVPDASCLCQGGSGTRPACCVEMTPSWGSPYWYCKWWTEKLCQGSRRCCKASLGNLPDENCELSPLMSG